MKGTWKRKDEKKAEPKDKKILHRQKITIEDILKVLLLCLLKPNRNTNGRNIYLVDAH